MSYSAGFLNTKVTVKIDRQLGTKHPKWSFYYPVNYGFIENTKAPDGEELDAYVLNDHNYLKWYAKGLNHPGFLSFYGKF